MCIPGSRVSVSFSITSVSFLLDKAVNKIENKDPRSLILGFQFRFLFNFGRNQMAFCAKKTKEICVWNWKRNKDMEEKRKMEKNAGNHCSISIEGSGTGERVSNIQLDSSGNRASDLNDRDPRFNTYWGNILLLHFFCFQVVKILMSVLPLLLI